MTLASILGNLLLGVEDQASLKFLILRKLIKSKKIAKKANTLTDLGPQGLDTLCVDIFSEQTITSELVQLLEHFGLHSDLHFAHRIIKLNFEFCDLGGEITINRRGYILIPWYSCRPQIGWNLQYSSSASGICPALDA